MKGENAKAQQTVAKILHFTKKKFATFLHVFATFLHYLFGENFSFFHETD